MSNELFLGPVYLVGYLWQESTTATTFADIDAMTMKLELIEALDATHRCKDGNLDVNLTQFFSAQRQETRVFESCCPCHLGYNLVKRNILTEMSDAASQLSFLMKGDESAALLVE